MYPSLCFSTLLTERKYPCVVHSFSLPPFLPPFLPPMLVGSVNISHSLNLFSLYDGEECGIHYHISTVRKGIKSVPPTVFPHLKDSGGNGGSLLGRGV